MRKFISTIFVISAFALTAFAQQGPFNPLPPNCHSGHINSPVLVCEPPQPTAARTVGDERMPADESTWTLIRSFIGDLKSFFTL